MIYASPLVDVAATVELADETIQMCLAILELTHWQIRLLSKSPLILKIADMIPAKYQARMIYGLSTGTLDDGVAMAIEVGAPLVSRRLKVLQELQDRGLRTFGMACPILPQADATDHAARLAQAIRADRCEHVWAEAVNVRGDSLVRTCSALRKAGYDEQAGLLEQVSGNRSLWEDYARKTFLALKDVVPAVKLRFLQYVKKGTVAWWREHEGQGAVLLGKAASEQQAHGPLTKSPIR